jgi:hypothetical protein
MVNNVIFILFKILNFKSEDTYSNDIRKQINQISTKK